MVRVTGRAFARQGKGWQRVAGFKCCQYDVMSMLELGSWTSKVPKRMAIYPYFGLKEIILSALEVQVRTKPVAKVHGIWAFGCGTSVTPWLRSNEEAKDSTSKAPSLSETWQRFGSGGQHHLSNNDLFTPILRSCHWLP